MIVKATKEDIGILSMMLMAMMKELFPEDASSDIMCYEETILSHFNNSCDIIYIDDKFRGFLVVRDDTEKCVPTRKIYNPMRIYIEPDYRHTRLLYEFYKKLFEDFPDGEIWGITEIHSKHIPVLDKRHECVAKVYKLRRPNWESDQQ